MEITINGETAHIEEGEISLTNLLKQQKVESPDLVSVQLNGNIIDQEQYDTTTITKGSEVEFLYFMGGGASTQKP